MNFTIVDTTGGQILRTGNCSNPDDLLLQAQNADETVLNFLPDVDGATHWNFDTRVFYVVETDPDEGLTQEQLVSKYWLTGSNYVAQYFNSDQKAQLMLILAATDEGLQSVRNMIQECLAWITSMQAACFASPRTFDAESFGEPPHTYFEIYSAYLAVINPQN